MADGPRTARRAGGGLVTALGGLLAGHDVTWVASAISAEDRAVAEEAGGRALEEADHAGNPFRLRLVAHEPAAYDRFYNVFANPLLWFIQHQLWPHAYRPTIDGDTRSAWQAYQAVNRALAAAAAEELRRCGPDTVALVHDYQLYTVPAELRRQAPEALIAHFVHIPWPPPSSWSVLPRDVRAALLEGLAASDLVGFHTARDVREFLRFCEDEGAVVDRAAGTARLGPRRVAARAFPISVDPDEFEAHARSPEVALEERGQLEDRPERVILRVDRTDPSKNIVRGFVAFDLFLEQHPEWRGRVRMLALLDPSRQEIPEYAEYLGAIRRAARQVGERWRDPESGQPAVDLRIHDNFPEVVAAYKHYDVLLVNALFDGMNLVAKEAPLVNARDGVLILSENAGAHAELGELALSVNPFDVQAQADAIAAALALDPEERRRRAQGLKRHVREHDVRRWADAQLVELDALAAAR